jgi:hypothetical protein
MTLESRLIAPVSVKSPDLQPPYLSWKNMGELDFKLAGKQSFTLVFQEVADDDVSITGSIRYEGCERRMDMVFDENLSALGSQRTWSFANPCGMAGDRLDVGLKWVGQVPRGTASELDDELAEDLRALGYLK